VYIKGDMVFINEVKPLNANGSISLSGNANTDLGAQMSDQWINGAIKRLAEMGTPDAAKTVAMLERAIEQNKLVKVVSAVDAKGMTIVKLSGK